MSFFKDFDGLTDALKEIASEFLADRAEEDKRTPDAMVVPLLVRITEQQDRIAKLLQELVRNTNKPQRAPVYPQPATWPKLGHSTWITTNTEAIDYPNGHTYDRT